MTKPLRIGWVRHGVTEWNQRGIIQGVTDIPLSQEGLRQARLLADRLAREGERWNGVYCSDLVRAVQTGETLASRLRIPLIPDARLRERSFGSAEGTTEAERLARWGAEWRSAVPDQENDESVRARGHEFVREIADKHAGEAWLVVTHGSFLARMLQSMCEGLDDAHLLNMSLTVLEREREGERWKPLLHNCTKHLSEAESKA
ncbi:histidine phosphatase family protein [Paenibacillaceae bacterium WGS1546]|uniref:histidine phosphatase family protein n=1 Tax=Cohnella sp. WGS1546 TaxID=3366810 RepID=UPI00372D584A